MRKLFSPLPPLFMLLLACAAAHAQPARPPEQSARCRAAAQKYIGPSPDKKHLTVEQENEYEYRGMKKYLRVCGDSDDRFTRQIKRAVASSEAAKRASSGLPAPARPVPKPPPAPCDEPVQAELYGRFRENFKGSFDQQMVAYKATKEYLCRCAEYDDKVTLYMRKWQHKYDSFDPYYASPEEAAEAVARADAQRPRCRCDEMREQLVNSLKGRVSGHDGSQRYDETVRKFLSLCGDTRRPIDRFLGEWLTKYDKSMREFDEKQQKKGEAPAKGAAK